MEQKSYFLIETALTISFSSITKIPRELIQGLKMENSFTELLDEAVRAVSGKLLEDQCRVGNRSAFVKEPFLDHLFFHILSDILVSKTDYSAMVWNFIKADTKVQNEFDAKLRDRVYDVLYKAQDGLT